jgi:ATP diphosphatase
MAAEQGDTSDPIHATEDGLPRLLQVMRRLRDPDTGCPWDREQDFASIAPYTIEEAYEVADAIERQAWDDLRDELGDLLLQTVYHAQMAAERGWFDFDAVARGAAAKMIDRHPHVFGDESADKSAAQQSRDWEARKAAERAARAQSGVLDDVAVNLPALTRAEKLQKRAARVGFDWDDAASVLDKVAEEAGELAVARAAGDAAAMADEFGDLLFAVVNLGRHLTLDPEAALRSTNAKFTRRFRFIEAALAVEGRGPRDATLEEMEALWQTAKLAERTD